MDANNVLLTKVSLDASHIGVECVSMKRARIHNNLKINSVMIETSTKLHRMLVLYFLK